MAEQRFSRKKEKEKRKGKPCYSDIIWTRHQRPHWPRLEFIPDVLLYFFLSFSFFLSLSLSLSFSFSFFCHFLSARLKTEYVYYVAPTTEQRVYRPSFLKEHVLYEIYKAATKPNVWLETVQERQCFVEIIARIIVQRKEIFGLSFVVFINVRYSWFDITFDFFRVSLNREGYCEETY